jgi:hypothetical protein
LVVAACAEINVSVLGTLSVLFVELEVKGVVYAAIKEPVHQGVVDVVLDWRKEVAGRHFAKCKCVSFSKLQKSSTRVNSQKCSQNRCMKWSLSFSTAFWFFVHHTQIFF